MAKKLIHCSYHKCLTAYFAQVLSSLYNTNSIQGYRHFNSRLDDFHEELHKYKVASVNNQMLDFEKLGTNFRISRFIRDPRDLIISGYFYHKRGAEAWSNIINPRKEDWQDVNGCIPSAMGSNHSYSSYLQSLSEEDGLIAEIDFRREHFASMLLWPVHDQRIKLFRYEDIIGNEWATFWKLLSFYGIPWSERIHGSISAHRFSAKKRMNTTKHIRNPVSGQWREHFTPKVKSYFDSNYKQLLELYKYK